MLKVNMNELELLCDMNIVFKAVDIYQNEIYSGKNMGYQVSLNGNTPA
jgi:hypothetical protein